MFEGRAGRQVWGRTRPMGKAWAMRRIERRGLSVKIKGHTKKT